MKAIEQLRNRLAAVGATLDESEYALNCDAPPGYVWSANNCTCYTIQFANNSQSWLTKAIGEAVAVTERERERISAQAVAVRKQKALRLLPAIERALIAGRLRGKPLDKNTRGELCSMRSEYRRLLGFTVDRECAEMPTDITCAQV